MRPVLSRHPLGRQAHPREDSLAGLTIAAGLIAFITGAVHDTHLVAVCVGIAAFFIGLYSQMISVTTTERWLNVLGVGMAFVGVGLGMSHGGFAV
jgi:uncharacterized integral membrane protein